MTLKKGLCVFSSHLVNWLRAWSKALQKRWQRCWNLGKSGGKDQKWGAKDRNFDEKPTYFIDIDYMVYEHTMVRPIREVHIICWFFFVLWYHSGELPSILPSILPYIFAYLGRKKHSYPREIITFWFFIITIEILCQCCCYTYEQEYWHAFPYEHLKWSMKYLTNHLMPNVYHTIIHALLYFLWINHSFQNFKNAIFYKIFQIPTMK